jgi:predicted nucleic-acid-binding Zn-ribbon protein
VRGCVYFRMTNQPQAPSLTCPLCRCPQFQQEEARSDSRWGFTSHRMTLLVCQNCRYVLHFYDKNSIFDFD